MDIKALTSLTLEVLKDWRVIAIAVLSILVIKLAVYVVKYRKKPPRIKKPKNQPKPEPKKEAPKEGQDQEDESDSAHQNEHK